ncbi:MAG: permease [Rubrivivax sp.]|nr:permease [Rubrivivax sp.]
MEMTATMAWLEAAATLASALLLEAGFWIVLSLAVGGLAHEFMRTEPVQRTMARAGHAGVLAGVGLGAMLPVCSCGVIPLTVSFFLGGARLAAVMAFTMATPVINPAAVVLAYALLGPELTLAYVGFGLVAPVVVGYVTERWGGVPTAARAAVNPSVCGCSPLPASACTPANPGPPPGTAASATMGVRVARALRWGFLELGPMLGFYIGIGIALAAALAALVPPQWISSHLGGSTPMSSLLWVALFGASIYVCAVAHIPLVAALLAAGAGPGAAIVFLVTGAATNLPEMLALRRVLGTRTVMVYVGSVVFVSLLAGLAVNLWLVDYQPQLDPLLSLEMSDLARRMTPLVPQWLAIGSAAIVAALAAWGTWNWFVVSATRLPLRLASRG